MRSMVRVGRRLAEDQETRIRAPERPTAQPMRKLYGREHAESVLGFGSLVAKFNSWARDSGYFTVRCCNGEHDDLIRRRRLVQFRPGLLNEVLVNFF